MSGIVRPQGVASYWAALHGFSFRNTWAAIRITGGTGVGRVMVSGAIAHIEDVLGDPDYSARRFSERRLSFSARGADAARRHADGILQVLARATVNPFTQKQIALVETFADQAAIAIENVRFLDEVKRTEDLVKISAANRNR